MAFEAKQTLVKHVFHVIVMAKKLLLYFISIFSMTLTGSTNIMKLRH